MPNTPSRGQLLTELEQVKRDVTACDSAAELRELLQRGARLRRRLEYTGNTDLLRRLLVIAKYGRLDPTGPLGQQQEATIAEAQGGVDREPPDHIKPYLAAGPHCSQQTSRPRPTGSWMR